MQYPVLHVQMEKRSYKIVPAFSFDFLTPFYDPIAELFGYGKVLKAKVLGMF